MAARRVTIRPVSKGIFLLFEDPPEYFSSNKCDESRILRQINLNYLRDLPYSCKWMIQNDPNQP